MLNLVRRLGVGVATLVAVVVATGMPAAAHVTVNPSQAPQGGFAKLAFRVPNEREVATTKVEVAFPEAQPLAQVSTRPVVGWTAKVTRAKLAKPITTEGEEVTEAVSRIVWTANSADTAIKVGEFVEFEVSAGPLPKAGDRMIFKALQTYADGEVVRWIEEPRAGEEPERPAPVLTLTKASGDDHHGGDTAAAGESDGHADAAANWPGWVGLVAGLAGLAVALVALVRSRRPTSAPAE